jgi:hypothetical protein
MTTRKRNWLKNCYNHSYFGGNCCGIYWYIATEKFADTKGRQALYSKAIDFIREFRKDDKGCQQKYREKIITVNGIPLN